MCKLCLKCGRPTEINHREYYESLDENERWYYQRGRQHAVDSHPATDGRLSYVQGYLQGLIELGKQ